jgi:hypothetical protein
MTDGKKAKLKKERYENLYMAIAEKVSKMSYAKRLQVGSVLVKNDSIISYGWNGMPSGWDNDCEQKTYIEIDPKWQFLDEDGTTYSLKIRPLNPSTVTSIERRLCSSKV